MPGVRITLLGVHIITTSTYPYQRSNWLGRGSFLDFCSDFHKIVVIRSSVCRTILIRRALESSDPGASNGVSNFIFRRFGADMAAFEVDGWPRVSNLAIG